MRVSLYGPEAQKAMRVPQPFYWADAHKAGLSFRAIASDLEADSVPTALSGMRPP